jgi:hypothetical protein
MKKGFKCSLCSVIGIHEWDDMTDEWIAPKGWITKFVLWEEANNTGGERKLGESQESWIQRVLRRRLEPDDIDFYSLCQSCALKLAVPSIPELKKVPQ